MTAAKNANSGTAKDNDPIIFNIDLNTQMMANRFAGGFIGV
jgi:hypothetical protein